MSSTIDQEPHPASEAAECEWLAWVEPYVRGEVDLEYRATLHKHLRECTDCALRAVAIRTLALRQAAAVGDHRLTETQPPTAAAGLDRDRPTRQIGVRHMLLVACVAVAAVVLILVSVSGSSRRHVVHTVRTAAPAASVGLLSRPAAPYVHHLLAPARPARRVRRHWRGRSGAGAPHATNAPTRPAPGAPTAAPVPAPAPTPPSPAASAASQNHPTPVTHFVPVHHSTAPRRCDFPPC